MQENARITIGETVIDCPITIGSEGEKGIDITKLRSQTGAVTLDAGFMNTGSCLSSITFIDGEKGILRYRGYDIEELAEKSTFIESAYILVHGEKPTSDQLDHFKMLIRENANIDQGVSNIIKQFPKTAHPMAVLSTAISSLSAFYDDSDVTKVTAQLMGQVKTIAAEFYRHTQGENAIKSSVDRDFCHDFLAMMFGDKGQNDVIAKALDILFILHADHEQNCSASTVRFVGSSKVNIFASIASGINALWGPLHGGANQAVIEMLEEIKADGGDYKKFILKAKDKNDPFRLMGFGHRVYKNFDPRARIIKKACDDILEQLGVNDPILDIAKGLEEEALKDPYFVERKLYPNVDFYSGIIYRALGIPSNMFTVMFAIGRMPGWIAQWKEMSEDSMTKIGRPRQIYTGHTQRNY